MCDELRALHDRLHATTVYVTHDQMEAMSMADTIAIMNQGVIEQLGAPQDVYERPASVFVADFIGSPSMNFLPFEGGLAQRRGRSADRRRRRSACRRCAKTCRHAPLLCGVRPEHVQLDDDSPLRAEVLGTEYLGTSQIVTLRHRAGRDLARQGRCGARRAARGDHVGLAFDASAVSLFDQTSRPRAAHRARRPRARSGARHG